MRNEEGHAHPQQGQHGDDVIKRNLGFPIDGFAKQMQRGQVRDQQPLRAGGETFPIERDQSHDFGHGQRGERKIRTTQAEADQANRNGHHHGQTATDHQAEPGRPPELQMQQHRGVGANAEEGGMTKRHLSGVAPEQVPRHAEQGREEHHDQHVVEKWIGCRKRCPEQRQRDHHPDDVILAHALPAPNRSDGRNSSTSRKSTKPMVSLYATET